MSLELADFCLGHEDGQCPVLRGDCPAPAGADLRGKESHLAGYDGSGRVRLADGAAVLATFVILRGAPEGASAEVRPLDPDTPVRIIAAEDVSAGQRADVSAARPGQIKPDSKGFLVVETSAQAGAAARCRPCLLSGEAASAHDHDGRYPAFSAPGLLADPDLIIDGGLL